MAAPRDPDRRRSEEAEPRRRPAEAERARHPAEAGGERVFTIQPAARSFPIELREVDLLATVLQQLPVGLGVADANGVWIVRNALIETYLPEAIPSKAPEQAARWREVDARGLLVQPHDWPCARALRGEAVEPVEMLFRSPRGEERWMRTSANPLRNGQGDILGAIVVLADIDRTKRAEMAVRESEERYRTLVGLLSDVPWTADASGAFVTPQLAWEQYTGEPFAAHRGFGWAEALHPEDRDRNVALWKRACETRTPYEAEGRIWHARSGRYRWFEAHAVPLLAPDGSVREWVGTMTDVDERRREEENLAFLAELSAELVPLTDAAEIARTAARRLREHLEVSHASFAELDSAGDELTVTFGDGGKGLLSEEASHHLADYMDEDALADLRAGQPLLVADVRTNPHTRAFAAKYERWGVVSMALVPHVRADQARLQLGVAKAEPHEWRPDEVHLLRDLAWRVHTRLHRAHAERALAEQRRLYQSVTDNASVALFITDEERRCVFVNPAAEAMLGYARDEVLGRRLHDVVHPRRPDGRPYPASECPLDQAFPEANRIHGEEVFLHRDGHAFDVAYTVSAIRGPSGAPLGTVIEAQDITERKRDRAALEEASRRKDEFLAMLSHELRNPLAPIRNAVQYLRLAGPAEPSLRSAQEVIERQVTHLARLVDDLLDVSRVSSGKVTLQKVVFDLGIAVRQAVETSRHLIDERSHQLTVSLPPEPVRVEGDVTRLAQVIGNLLDNAAKYTDDGGRIALTVQHTGSGDRAEAQIRVQDDGRGMDPEALAHVFDLFYQADRNLDRGEGGLGIGLSLVKSLVEMHGGSVEARSPGRGKGSEIVVRLPVVRAEEPAGGGDRKEERAAAKRGLRVLVVDDNRDSAESLAILLRLGGHDVTSAEDGRKAVEVALGERPDVVLLDIGLPYLDGYRACRAMREGGLVDALIIAVTGYGQEEDRKASHEAGFDAHLVKPVDLAKLSRLLARRAEER